MVKINSHGYGYKILAAIAVFLVVIPAVLYGLSFVVVRIDFGMITQISLALGSLLLLFQLVLLIVELHQDRKINKRLEADLNRKLPLGNGLYECQACGNREVHPEQKLCGVCGAHFKE